MVHLTDHDNLLLIRSNGNIEDLTVMESSTHRLPLRIGAQAKYERSK